MDKLKRTVFFWTLVVLFLIITPAVVLNAWGYRFDSGRGVFVHSGTITLKSNPQDFNVYVDGSLEPSKTLNRINSSYNLTGLLPKSYDITASVDGFQPWRKKMDVHSGLATEFWNVLLVRNNYERAAYGTGGAEKFFISPKNDYAAIMRQDGNGTSVSILRLNDKAVISTFTFSDWQFASESGKENVEWSPDENHISVPLQKIVATPKAAKTIRQKSVPQNNEEKIERTYFILDPAANDNTSQNLNDFIGKTELKDARWDPQDKNYIFFLNENSLYRANISDESDIQKISENVSSYDLSKANVYFTQTPNELVFKTSLDGKSEPTQITSTFPNQVSTQNSKLIVYDDTRIAFLNSSKDLYIFNEGELGTYFKKLGSGIEGMQFSDDGKKLVFWTNNEIYVYFTRQWNVQPTRNEDELQTITRYSDPIKNVQWFKDYEHVIFSTGPYVKIIELDARDHRISMDLLKTNADSPFLIYNNSLERLFFADNQENSSDLYSINFPEPTNFLGIIPLTNQ